MYERNVVQLNI